MKLVIVIILALSSSVIPQFRPGAKQISLSNSTVAQCNDVFALFNNPAGLAQFNWREIGIYYSPAPFALKELSNAYFAYTEPTSIGAFSLGAMTYGFDLYKENKISIGYSYNYLNNFFAGLVFNYHTLSIKKYGSSSAYYINFGLLAYITNELRWGFSVQNLNRATFGEEKDQIPVIFNSGFSYDILPSVSVNASIEKDMLYNASFAAGLEYAIVKYVSLRSGFSNEPSRYSAGIGINVSLFHLDYAMFVHQILGITHQVGLIISFNKNENRLAAIKDYLFKR